MARVVEALVGVVKENEGPTISIWIKECYSFFFFIVHDDILGNTILSIFIKKKKKNYGDKDLEL